MAEGGRSILNLQAAGILSVAPVATSGRDCTLVSFPAGLPQVLSVGALDADPTTNIVAHYSSEGPNLMAQGDAVRSSWLNNGYRVMSGMHMAAPAVSGVAALVMSAEPRWINDPVGVAELLKTTANPEVVSHRTCSRSSFGHGLVDAEAAVIQALR